MSPDHDYERTARQIVADQARIIQRLVESGCVPDDDTIFVRQQAVEFLSSVSARFVGQAGKCPLCRKEITIKEWHLSDTMPECAAADGSVTLVGSCGHAFGVISFLSEL